MEEFQMEQHELVENGINYIRKKIIRYGIPILAAVLLIIACIVGYKVYFSSESKTTKLGFEDIGELATQSAYCTEINLTDASRKLWRIEIPFTQSKYIYSYDFIVKAGFDFEQIDWKEHNKTITVKLPEVKILSSEPVDDSFKVFHEQESIFRQVKLTETIDTIEEMKENAVKNSIENGLYENAKKNAETMLTAFFGSVYDLEEYQIKFVYK